MSVNESTLKSQLGSLNSTVAERFVSCCTAVPVACLCSRHSAAGKNVPGGATEAKHHGVAKRREYPEQPSDSDQFCQEKDRFQP
jgi:hypothetical protein